MATKFAASASCRTVLLVGGVGVLAVVGVGRVRGEAVRGEELSEEEHFQQKEGRLRRSQQGEPKERKRGSREISREGWGAANEEFRKGRKSGHQKEERAAGGCAGRGMKGCAAAWGLRRGF
eukprot:1144398-Pelagomonas_calceolata.AAC.1